MLNFITRYSVVEEDMLQILPVVVVVVVSVEEHLIGIEHGIPIVPINDYFVH
jgi:hypothetical protein